jgi:Ser/Thr protein kinase RdoA (MazF antagonist)
MRAFATLSRRGQLGRLRRLGRAALAGYGLGTARLTPLRHEHNTTFRVDARGGPYVLRINRPAVHAPDVITSEMAWLAALRRDTDLGVPEPIATREGSLVVVARDEGVPEARACVLLRRLEGRFVDRRLTPAHLRKVGVLTAQLQEHAGKWAPPQGFLRPRIDTLTSPSKLASVSPSPAVARSGDHPT